MGRQEFNDGWNGGYRDGAKYAEAERDLLRAEVSELRARLDLSRAELDAANACLRDALQTVKDLANQRDAANATIAAVAEALWELEKAKPHIPISTDPNRMKHIVERSTLNVAIRKVRAALGADLDTADATIAQFREERNAVHADLVAILNALGLGDHARPYSSHDVVQREVLPAVAERDATIDKARAVLGPTRWRLAMDGEGGAHDE